MVSSRLAVQLASTMPGSSSRVPEAGGRPSQDSAGRFIVVDHCWWRVEGGGCCGEISPAPQRVNAPKAKHHSPPLYCHRYNCQF
jgi:hypothetical protein